MTYDNILIADMSVGLELDKEPFLLPNDAFPQLENAYLWRKRIKKKLGHGILGRLRRVLTAQALGNTDGAGNFSGNIKTILSLEANSAIEPGSITITIGAQTFTEPATPNGTLSNGGAGTGTINYSTMALTLNTDPNLAAAAITIDFNYFPTLPVMGLPERELIAINAERAMAFDTVYSYEYNNASNSYRESPSTLTTRWSGSNSDFFWSINAYKALFTTNAVKGFHSYEVNRFQNATVGTPWTVDVRTTAANNLVVGDQVIFINLTGPAAANNGFRGQVTAIIAPDEVTISNPEEIDWTNDPATTGRMIVNNQNISGDGIRWYDGTTWMNFTPVVNLTTAVQACSFMIEFRDRLILFDTTEGNEPISPTRFPQRARWCQNGTPFNLTPVPTGSNEGTDPQAWREDVVGKGGFIDAPTTEIIISASLIRDNLIVTFERSTWRLRYTGNEILPFVWERINADFGCESTFSTVYFDAGPMYIGSRGIFQTDGVNVQRVDIKIPDVVFSFHNENSGPIRIHGVRDFDEKVVYWTFPNDDENGTFPNRILLLNYEEKSWAILRDSFTTFGRWQPFFDLTWEKALFSWESAMMAWNSFKNQALYSQIIGGNQQGYVMKIQYQTVSDQSLYINSITNATPSVFTSTNHNLRTGQFVRIINAIGTVSSEINDITFEVVRIDNNTFSLLSFSALTNEFSTPLVTTGTYSGLGEIRVIDNFTISTKKFNPYLDQNTQAFIGESMFYLDTTDDGKFTVNIYIDDNNSTPMNPPDSDNPEYNVVETFLNEFDLAQQTKVWHSLFNECTGTFFQLELTYSDAQINNFSVVSSGIVLHAIMLRTQPAGEDIT